MDYTTGRRINSIENQTVQNLTILKINNENVAQEVNEQTELVTRVNNLESTVNFLVNIINDLLNKTIPDLP